MSTEDVEPRRAENSESSGGQLWNSIAGLLCCCTSSAARAPGVDIAAKEPKSKGEKKDKTPKKKSKGNDSSSSDDNTNLFQSEETLFGKQWFGYSRKVSKKGKSLQKNTNLDDVGTETKPIDTNIMKAKMDVRQRQKRAPSAQHMKRMISHDVFDSSVPQDTVKAADEQPQSEASKTIPEENPVEAKTEETQEKVESSESPEQKPNGEAKNPEEKPEDAVEKQENPAATKEEEVVTSASGETAKEKTSAENSDSEKSNETKNVTKDVTEVTVTSSDVTMTPGDAVKDAAVTPVDVKGISDLKPQDTVDTSSSAAAVTSTASTVAKDETLDSPLSPPMTKESPAESSPPKTNNDKEPVLSNQENGSPASPSDLVLQANDKNTTPVEENEENVLNVETSKNKEQAEEKTNDERTENKNDGGSRPEAEPAEVIKDEQEKEEKTEAEKEISSSESHLPAEAMIKAQET